MMIAGLLIRNLAAAALAVMASSAIAAPQEPVTYQCESGHRVVLHLDVVDETVQSARLDYDGRTFDMFVVGSGDGLRLSTEQGLAPDRGLQWESRDGAGRLSEMIMDHTAGGPAVIETCALAVDGPGTAAGMPRISGEVFYLERIAIPGTPQLTLTLFDLDTGGTLASTSFEAPGSRVSFDLYIDAPGGVLQRQLGLGAELRSEGKLWFAADEPIVVNLESDEPLSIRVVRASDEVIEGSILPVGSWLATAIGASAVVPGIEVTLVIEADGTVSGNGGCNNFGGRAIADAAGLGFANMFSTNRACLDSGAGQERLFLQALDGVSSFHMEDGNLVLVGGDGRERVRFAPL